MGMGMKGQNLQKPEGKTIIPKEMAEKEISNRIV
jgi:hypothetical protein